MYTTTKFNTMRKAIIYYHWLMFFLQWLRFYIIMVKIGIETISWARRYGIPIFSKSSLDLITWSSWKKYKRINHYMLHTTGVTYMICTKDMFRIPELLQHLNSRIA